MKRGLIVPVLVILLLPIAFAIHTATVTSNYNSIYETNSANITLTIENGLFSSASINNVNIQTNGFAVNNIVNVLGWTLTNNNSINFATTTNAISNWGTQRFGFTIAANNVAQDTPYDWTITTDDTSLDSQTNVLQFTILNDNTAPVVTATTPGNFNLGANELFSITANDPETGIANANLHISNCDLIFNNATNSSNMSFSTIPLSCANDMCSSTQDLTSWSEGDVCFYYDISNKGGETALTNNLTTIIDRTAPTVSLTSPSNNIFLNTTTVALTIDANDNYDTDLNCSIVVNGNANSINGIGTLTQNLAVNDGVYTWSALCIDEVGLIGNSQTQTFTIDNQGPNMTLIVPAVNNRGNDVIINTSITDLGSGIDQSSVTAEITDTNGNVTIVSVTNNQITYPTTTSTIPGTYTATVTAKDNLGQQTTQSISFRIRETFTITLTLSQNQIDASTQNLTRYVNLTGTIKKDDNSIPVNTVEIIEPLTTENLAIDNQTGNFVTQIEIPQLNGGYTIIANYVNGIDTFSVSTLITVGPYCGNNVADNSEECDGTDLNNKTCSDFGYSQGTLSCSNTCTIETNQCSNPGNSGNSNRGGSGRSGGTSRSSSSGFVYVPPQPEEPKKDLISEEVITEEPKKDLVSGNVIEEGSDLEAITGTTIREQEGFGVGTAWASLSDYTKKFNSTLLLVVAVIGVLLYVFGWKKEDEWDRYFRRYGHH